MKFSALEINLGAPEVKLYVLVSKLGDLGARVLESGSHQSCCDSVL